MQAATMAPRTTTSLVVFVLVATVAASTSLADAAASASYSSLWSPRAPPPPCAASQSVVAFLRARCATTLYRVTCYDSLIPYGCTFQTSHVKLARAAADVNAAQLRTFSSRVKELVARGGRGEAPAAAAALRDCASTVSSAAGLAKQSAAELAKLDAAGAAATERQARWAVSNAQTWLSAAMTNEATCADGLGASSAVASPAAEELVAGVVTAKQYTGVALALVNGIPLK